MRDLFAIFMLLAAAASPPSVAEEGMWTFDNPPVKQLQDRYGFTPAQQWLDHIRLSSVRFNDGGSGSFVSSNGLAITNHHVAFGQLQKLSNPQKCSRQLILRRRNGGEWIQCAVSKHAGDSGVEVHTTSCRGLGEAEGH